MCQHLDTSDECIVDKEVAAEIIEFGKKLEKKYGERLNSDYDFDIIEHPNYALHKFVYHCVGGIDVELYNRKYGIVFRDYKSVELKLRELSRKLYGIEN